MSGFMDLLEGLLTAEKPAEAKPETPRAAPPAEAPPSPTPVGGWSPAPVQADAPNTYQIPSGWTVPGQAPQPTTSPGQADAPNTYQIPPGWSVAQQQQAAQAQQQQAAMQAALAQRFGR